MSHSHLTAASSSNFQLIINNALDAYKKRTKDDLLAHPLASQLQACDSPDAILAVLQQQVQGIDQSRSGDRWTKWLDPTVNVLFAFSSTLGAGVGLVCLRTPVSEICALIFIWQVFSPTSVIFAGIGVLLSVRILNNVVWSIITRTFLRQLRMFGRAKTPLLTSSSASRCFSDVSRCTLTCRRRRK
jgi:hypothetical protein